MIDGWTASTVRQMCRYIADDARIARHVGCALADVQAVRRQVHDSADNRVIGRKVPPAPKSEILHAAFEPWARDARVASQALAEALERYRGSAA